MPLITSPRHTAADLAHWMRLERFDRILAESDELQRLEDRALAALEAFAAAGPCYVGTSWGKDSTVVAHLAWRLGVGPLAWFPAGRIENPDCVLVRDAFLSRFPCDYREIEAVDDELHGDGTGHDGFQAAFERVSKQLGSRYISGVRAEESTVRAMRMSRWGEASPNTCAPIGRWGAQHVFAYLAKYDLPIHPAYACTFGGTLDRGRVRVGTIGGYRGTGRGRRDWEQHYYPEVVP